MNETSQARVFLIVQVVGAVLTGVVVLTGSAALAWTLRGWREAPPAASAPGPVSVSVSGRVDRDRVLQDAGRLAYQVHCVRCHGAEGHGDGSDAERLNPPPRDFAAGQWRLAPTAENLRQVIVAGIPGTAMPGWGDSLSRRELEGLVAYVQALAPPPASLKSALERAGFVAAAAPDVAPELAVRDLDGNPATLSSHRGRPVLVVFWGTTCSHCLSELPAVFAASDRLRDRGLALDVLAVCVDETDPVVVRDVAGPHVAARPLYLDPAGTARLYYDVQALPTLVLIDAGGRLAARGEGTRDWSGSGSGSGSGSASGLALAGLIRSLSLSGPARGDSPDAAPGDHRPR
jgi:mono/diheme cytochrome c family protein